MTTLRDLLQALLDGKELYAVKSDSFISLKEDNYIDRKGRRLNYFPRPDSWKIINNKEEKPMTKQYMKNEKEFMEALLRGEELTTDFTKEKIYLLEDGNLVYEDIKGAIRSILLSNIADVHHWFIVPKTININGFEVPEPEREPLPIGTMYWSPYICTVSTNLVVGNYWGSHTVDNDLLNAGLVHLTKEAAELHAKALLSFTQLKEA